MPNPIAPLTEYLKQNKLLFEGQYGFRENHSTELATIELMDRVISALDEKNPPPNHIYGSVKGIWHLGS